MNAQLDSDLLRTFVAIADGGSFTAAADRVGRTQSAVSMQMKRLQTLVDESLFIRGPRGVALTAPGERLLADAQRILSLLDQAAVSLRRVPLSGRVRLGILEEYGVWVFPELLSRFADLNPGVEVTVRCGHSGVLNRALDDGALDLAVVLEDSTGSNTEVLMRDRTLWAASTRHAVHEQDPLPVALFEPGCWWRDWAEASLQRLKRDYRIAYTSASNSSLKAAVAAGLAVGVLAESMVPPDCRALTPKDGFVRPLASHVMIRRADGTNSDAVEGMARAIKAAFRVRGGQRAPARSGRS